ncbi:MAG TPA: sigma-54 dependent transcriptional regulator [Thermoanaerobaculia bacterium]|nr:sigma-54 dependent transcriptional regulator [Thermoanaerobaculia bacterium]
MSPVPAPHPCGILVVDDDERLAGTLQELLVREGYAVEVALSAAEATAILERRRGIALALVDLIMPGTDGLALMDDLHRRYPELAVIVMTGYGTIETAVEAIKRGAEDYLTKPMDSHALRKKVARLMEVFELRERVRQLETNLESAPSFEGIISVSSSMRRVIERAQTVAATESSVLLLGETGTGKEMMARAIHAASPRAGGVFLPVNCGALPRELVESELFGVRRGAYTGAYADTPGIFAAATGGTVFLDEIGEMPREAQVKLLRVLQERELRPVGSAATVHVDVRIISASNRPLTALRAEYLRQDFYFRIATVVLEIPPLRARPEDVLVLAQHFLGRLSRRSGREIVLAHSAADVLVAYPFPGNVRELENVLESATAVSRDDPQTITDRDVKPLLGDAASFPMTDGVPRESLSLERLEDIAIQQALHVCGGNRTRAAGLLGISRDTLYRKLRQARDRESG